MHGRGIYKKRNSTRRLCGCAVKMCDMSLDSFISKVVNITTFTFSEILKSLQNEVLLHTLLSGIVQPSSPQAASALLSADNVSNAGLACSSSQTLLSAWVNVSLGWAPEIAYLRLTTKYGTPEIPNCLASSISACTSGA